RLRCGAPRRRRRLAAGPALLYPPPQYGIAQAKFLGYRSDRAATRCDQINRLSLVVVRKRSSLTSFHQTPLGSPSLLQVSTELEEAQSMQPNGGTKGEARYRLSDGLANASVEDMRLSFVGRVLA